MAVKRNRVFLGLLDIGGYMAGLEAGLRALRCDVFHLNLDIPGGWFRASGNAHPVTDFYKYCVRVFRSPQYRSRYNPGRYFWGGMLLFSLATLLVWMCLRFDIIILKSGVGLTTNLFDLRLFRFMRKKLVFLYLGSDSRPPYLLGYWGGDAKSAPRLVELTREVRNNLDRRTPYADYIFDNPLSAHFQTRRCYIVQCLGCILDPKKLRFSAVSPSPRTGGIRVVHVPSNAGIKGTDVIRSSVARCRERGYVIDYRELQNRPNSEVIAELAQCDLVIDELYSDSYGGLLAIEAATFSKPVLIAGYGEETLERYIPKIARVPVVYCSPEEFDETFERLINDAPWREKIGMSANKFVESWARPDLVAKRLLLVVNGQAPSEWQFDPHNIGYIYGAGGSKAKVRKAISKVLDEGGMEALCLAEKPQLVARLRSFIEDPSIDDRIRDTKGVDN